MSAWLDHLIVAPILLPMLAGVAAILIGDRSRAATIATGFASAIGLVALAAALLALSDAPVARAYRLGDWPASFGIVLVLDRLAALMLMLAALLGLAAFSFSLGRWARAGAHFHPLFHFQLMGLNGAFLAGDIFNLFVFFEVMLAASYGLALHGSGTARVRAGLHYIVINLVASAFFLVGVSVLYGVAGTLNMADLAARMRLVEAEDRGLVEAGAAILGIAFLTKAAIWPLGFWLPSTYAAASTPAAAIISILSKVGIYAVLRMWLLLFGEGAGASQGFAGAVLTIGGLATVAFGSIAVLATQNLARLAGASVLVSSGTLLAAIGAGQAAVTGGALFYMTSSVLAIAALFLLIELVERGRDVGADVLAVTREAFGTPEEEPPAEEAEVGIAIPGTLAVLGLAFLACALLLAGLPPLSGFLAKFAILAPLLGAGPVPATSWLLLSALVLSGFATIIAMARTGIEVFWAAPAGALGRVALVEIAPVAGLLLLTVALTLAAGPAMEFMQRAAEALHAPHGYVRGVLDPLP